MIEEDVVFVTPPPEALVSPQKGSAASESGQVCRQ